MTKLRGFSPFFAALAALGAAACSNSQETAVCAGDGVAASDAWARATRPGQTMGAAYVRLCNGTGALDRLVAVTFDGAEAAELHTSSTTEDGVASMAPLENGLALPPGEIVTMAPGGTHIMLIGLEGALSEGDKPSITLHFENAPQRMLVLDVRAQTAEAEHGAH